MSKKYLITEKFKGYATKKDSTKLPQGFLVEGSQNVLSTDGDNMKVRLGYELDGAKSSSDDPILSSFDWQTNTGVERNIRSFGATTAAVSAELLKIDDTYDIKIDGSFNLEIQSASAASTGSLQFRYVDGDEILWTDIATGFTSSSFDYTTWWDVDQNRDILLFVNGTDNIYSWSGGAAKIGTTTSNTIQLLDTNKTWIEERFLLDGTFTVNYNSVININGTEYTYTGGETTNTLTGVTPDPRGEASASLAVQKLTEHSNTPGNDSTLFSNDLIKVLKNQIWVGSLINNNIFVSKNNDFTDFSFTSPRLPGEGATLTLDGPAVGFMPQEEDMYTSAGKDQWYQSRFTLSDDNLNETLNIERLKTGQQQAAYSQNAIAKTKNSIIFMSNEPTFDSLGRVENVNSPQAEPISDPIKPDFDNADLTGIDTKYFRNNIYITLPSESRVYVFNLQKAFWEAPQILPVSSFAIIGGELYGHSSTSAETYKLFTTMNDNGNPIAAIAAFSYQNYGDRVNLKNFDEFYTEGKIASNTELTLKINYEYGGSETIKEFDIKGSDSNILFQKTEDSSLGKNPIGSEPLGNTGSASSDLGKFRQMDTVKKTDFHEHQIIYKSDGIDQSWELLAYGANIQKSTSMPNILKK